MGKGEACATHARGEALLYLCVNRASRSPCVCLFCRLKEREWDSVRTACLLIFVHLNVWFWEFASSEAHDGLNSIENFWRYISVLIWPRNGKFVSDFLIFTLKGWLVIRYVNNSSSRRGGGRSSNQARCSSPPLSTRFKFARGVLSLYFVITISHDATV